MKVGVGVFEGMEELDFAGPYEVLTAWSNASDGRIDVVAVGDATEPVRCSHGLRVVPDTTYADVERFDVFVLPGGMTRGIGGDPSFLERMRAYAEAGTLMASVCTGALVYAKAGLLDGREATTHWGALEVLGSYGEGVKVNHDARFVDAGPVITAAGVSAGIDMALHLIARLDSVEVAREVRRYIQYDPQPPV
jgi:transcriptional regulator GlxA family with amidase domain